MRKQILGVLLTLCLLLALMPNATFADSAIAAAKTIACFFIKIPSNDLKVQQIETPLLFFQQPCLDLSV